MNSMSSINKWKEKKEVDSTINYAANCEFGINKSKKDGRVPLLINGITKLVIFHPFKYYIERRTI